MLSYKRGVVGVKRNPKMKVSVRTHRFFLRETFCTKGEREGKRKWTTGKEGGEICVSVHQKTFPGGGIQKKKAHQGKRKSVIKKKIPLLWGRWAKKKHLYKIRPGV